MGEKGGYSVTYDRSEVQLDDVFDISDFTDTANIVEESLTLGPLNPKPIIFDKDLIKDYLVIETPLASKTIGFDRWSEIPLLVPLDGGELDAIYCRAEGNLDKEGNQKYVDIPIKIKTEQKNHGLSGFYSNKLFTEEGRLIVDVNFAPRVQESTFSDVARVKITDLVTGGVFYDYFTQQDVAARVINLEQFLFHDENVLVEVETLDENDMTSYSVSHGNTSGITQTDIQRNGAFVEFRIDLTGEFASQISDDIEVSALTQRGATSLATSLEILNIDGGVDQDGGAVKSVTLRLPIDFVVGSTKMIRILDRSNPVVFKISSISHSGLLNFLPARGIAETKSYPIKANFNAGTGTIEGVDAGLVTVDVSTDLKRWSRVESFMNNEQGGDQEVSLPNIEFQRGFYRARVYVLDE